MFNSVTLAFIYTSNCINIEGVIFVRAIASTISLPSSSTFTYITNQFLK
ncbi:hypothetical protein [Iningainema tapete]|uniref:Uncharacterized protein n=1 Tax=Iningainema tapete BLCC-T55 TaxID=2748662 RepID=A0A8J6Y0E6_9CYAN|nr:hypothetical protein [Iningainema tapete]MBD2776758.1 hypothetical protein [Iningainema tapete BLCC-T55]